MKFYLMAKIIFLSLLLISLLKFWDMKKFLQINLFCYNERGSLTKARCVTYVHSPCNKGCTSTCENPRRKQMDWCRSGRIDSALSHWTESLEVAEVIQRKNMFFTIDKIGSFSKITIHSHSKINYKCSKDKTFEFHIYKLDFHYICTSSSTNKYQG